jgi:uncharacterized protein YndB with AHSA1/START domain
MSNDSNRQVQVARNFSASAERVFDAWLDPKQVEKWLFTTDSSRIVCTEIDARVGGEFLIIDRRGDDDVEHTGKYLEIERPRRLAFTLLVAQFSDHVSKVAIDIEEDGESQCQLTLTHSDVLFDFKERVAAGWAKTLDMLGEVGGIKCK